jgi:hypothetical protein
MPLNWFRSKSVTGAGPLTFGPDGKPVINVRARVRVSDRLRAGWEPVGRSLSGAWGRGRFRRAAIAASVLALAGAGVGLALALKPARIPNTLEDDLPDVLGFALLRDDFNTLPLKDRLAILKDLFGRLKGMGQSDSRLLSAFAAGITGKAREQLQKNMEKLFSDLWADEAGRYAAVPGENRAKALDDALLRMIRTAEDISGFSEGLSDEEVLARARRDAKRDEKRIQDREAAGRTPSMDRMATRVMDTVQRGSEFAKPAQRGQMALFARDLTRNLRGQDLDTGKPIEQPGAQPGTQPGAEPPPRPGN